MSSFTPEKPESSEAVNTAALLEKLTQLVTIQQTQMVTMQNALATIPQPAPHTTTQSLAVSDGVIHSNPIDVKMDGTNYAFWCQAVEMYIQGRDRMKHLTGEPSPPPITSPLYQKWAVDDVIVKGWLINSLEPRLRGSYIRHPMARDVWKAIATTFYDGCDEAQVFALNRQVSHLKQGGRAIEGRVTEVVARN